MDSTANSKSCNLCYFKACQDPNVEDDPKTLTTSTNTSSCCIPVYKKLDGLAGWLLNNMAAAFFASLQHFSCIHIDTKDDPADDYIYLPLNGNGCQEEVSAIEIPIASEICEKY
ncbi:hypothetical protein ACFX13_028148 [Malus domestica]